MAGYAKQFGQHDADNLDAVGDLDSGQFLHRQHIGQVVHHAAQIVDAIGIGDIGVPGLALPHLFGPPVVESDFGDRIHDFLAVQLQRNAKSAVGTGMLRTQIEKHQLCVAVASGQTELFGLNFKGLFFALLLIHRKLKWSHFRGAGRMFLAQGMPLPGGGQQNPPQVGMSGKVDAEHVPYFSFIPFGRGPEPGDRFQTGILPLQRHFDAQVLIAIGGKQMIDDTEVALGLIRAVGPPALVDGCQIVEHPIRAVGLLFKVP